MLTAVTIDFWNTIVDTANGDARRRYRNDALREAFALAGRELDEDAVHEAMKHVYAVFEERWFGEQRTMTASESLRVMWTWFGFAVPDDVHVRIAQAYEDSIVVGMPNLLPGASDAIRALAARYRLALISDTAFSPGRALRRVLEARGILDCFTTLVFSDEIGVSKPHARAFHTALGALDAAPAEAVHIGDIERTDIAGAKEIGMKAVLFTAGGADHAYNDGISGTRADAIADSWQDVPGIIETLSRV